MKPLMSRTEDTRTLENLGRASFQIVHDLKNQLNGLKLYATFLRRRLEKTDRPEDEQETIAKLISGLDRAANDLSAIVEYGREIELRKQIGVDVQGILQPICSNLSETSSPIVYEPDLESLRGEFDPLKLTDAFNWICMAAKKRVSDQEGGGKITVSASAHPTE
jgi:signal transduction histidine kinase